MLNPVTVSAFALPPRTALPDQQEASVERGGGKYAVSKSLTPDSLTSLFPEKSEGGFSDTDKGLTLCRVRVMRELSWSWTIPFSIKRYYRSARPSLVAVKKPSDCLGIRKGTKHLSNDVPPYCKEYD